MHAGHCTRVIRRVAEKWSMPIRKQQYDVRKQQYDAGAIRKPSTWYDEGPGQLDGRGWWPFYHPLPRSDAAAFPISTDEYGKDGSWGR